MTTILFAGGGSGGHLYPGIAVAEELTLLEPSLHCLFVGSDRPIEHQILTPTGFEHAALPVSPSSQFLSAPFFSAFSNWLAYRAAREILARNSPSAVIGLGGFASVPVVLAAWRRKTPVLLLEQNAVLGRANRFLLPVASRLCLSLPRTPIPSRYRDIAVLMGNPVRRDVINSLRKIANGIRNPVAY